MGTLLVLLLISVLLLPAIINLEPVRERILAAISRDVQADLVFQRVDLSLFPRPRLVLRGASLSIPGKVSGFVESLKIYPRILPLLRGTVRLARLRAEGSDFTVKLPEGLGKKERFKASPLAVVEEKLAPALALLALRATGLEIRVERGRLRLIAGDEKLFFFEDIEAWIKLPPDRLEFEASSSSNLWESISLKGWVDPEDLKARGRIELTRFHPEMLAGYLPPPASELLGDSRINLNVSFETEGAETLRAEVEGSIPSLTFRGGSGDSDERTLIKAKSFRGSLHLDESEAKVSLAELTLDQPRLRISGKLLIDRASRRVSLELEGREVDVPSVRKVSLALAEGTGVVQEVFEVVRGGRVPLITFNARGSSIADLGKAENLLIKGEMVEGKVFVPKARLHLEDVKGNVVISKGMLEGRELEARLGNSRGREGELKLGLKGGDAPFHLDIVVEADLSQLPPLLDRLVKDETFKREMALIREFKGDALGRLVLGESTRSIKLGLDVQDFNLYARYQRVPHPLEIEGGKFSYGEAEIAASNLKGRMGSSSFSGLSGRLDWRREPYLELVSGRSKLFLDELYQWLLSFERLRGAREKLRSAEGTITLSALELKGPLLRPEKWSFRIQGEVEGFKAESALFSGPVAAASGKFEATPEKLSLTDFQASILDASLEVSGALSGYLEGIHKADLTLQGDMGPEATRWATGFIRLPPELRVRAPLSISSAHLVWERGASTSFSGNMAIRGGPQLTVDILHSPEGLRVKDLLIRGEESSASFSFNLKGNEVDLAFRGELNKKTLDGLLARNQFLSGWIRGDMRAHILLDRPLSSTTQGKLRVAGLKHPWKTKVPFEIKSVSLDMAANKVKVESASFTWGESRLNLEGNLSFSAERILVDMNLSADSFNWEEVEEILGEGRSPLPREKSWLARLQGTLRVSSERFKYGRFSWKPFHADISFSQDAVNLAVSEALLCGISTPGTLKLSGREIDLQIEPVSRGQPIEATLSCLWDKEGLMSGNFDLEGKVTARGMVEELVPSLRGNLKLLAKDGRINRFGLLAKVFGFLNVSDLVRGKLPDLQKEGFAYKSVKAEGELRGGRLVLKEGLIEGSSMDIACSGDVELVEKKLDLKLLVAPLKSANFVIKHTPLIERIFGGNPISIPLKVTGDISAPKVAPLSPKEVGSGLLGIIKRSLGLPLKGIEPLIRGPKEEKSQ